MTRSGIIVVDKPGGMTSHDVVARIRRIVGTRKVGHAGTLDPMATGVLVIGVERATRLLTYIVGHDKRYLATIRLGQSTITDDAEGEIVSSAAAAELAPAVLSDDAIVAALARLTGEIDQVPSAVSAIKIKGVRSYARVRAGEDVTLPARRVTVRRLDPLNIRREPAAVDVDVDVVCSSGTYIRALARDAGSQLGVGGHLTALRRAAVGNFTVTRAVSLDDLAALAEPVTIPMSEAAGVLLPRREVGPDEAKRLSNGGRLPAIGIAGPYGVFGPNGEVIAIVAERDGQARPEVVLAPA